MHTYMFKALFENIANLKFYINYISLLSSHQKDKLSDIYPYAYIYIYIYLCVCVCKRSMEERKNQSAVSLK